MKLRAGIVDDDVRVAHAAYDFPSADVKRAFLMGVAEGRGATEWSLGANPVDWMIVTDPRVITSLGRPLRDRLIDAIKRDDEEAVTRILATGIDPSGRDGTGRSAVHWAAEMAGPAVMKKVLDAGGASHDPVMDDTRASPLIIAARSSEPGRAEVMQVLIDDGAPLDASDAFSRTALHHAILIPDEKRVQVLAQAGANPMIVNGAGQTPLQSLENRFGDLILSIGDSLSATITQSVSTCRSMLRELERTHAEREERNRKLIKKKRQYPKPSPHAKTGPKAPFEY
jgi:hypothetical protein